MGKQPAIMFYVGDYLKDTRHLSLEAKGAWTDLLLFMFHAEPRGQITLPIDGFSRLLGAGQEQTIRVLNELVSTRVCDCLINGSPGDMSPFCPPNVPTCPLNVTIINRRMAREEKQRDYNRLKKQKQRSNKGCPENVKPPLSSSSSSSSSSSFSFSTSEEKEIPPTPLRGSVRKRKHSAIDCNFSDDFEAFWKAYPKKRGKPEAWAAWQALDGTRPPLDVLLESVRRHAATEEWIKDRGQYIPWPQKFLNNGRWMDEIEDRSGQRVSDLTLRNIENAKAVLAERAARRSACGK